MASAKQRAWRRRFASMARRRAKTRKSYNRRRSKTRRMARRKRSYSRVRRMYSRARSSKRLGGLVGTVKPMAAGIGGGLIGESIADRVMPQASPIAGYGGAYLFGGIKGVIGKVIYDVTIGRGSPFGGLGGGGGAGL